MSLQAVLWALYDVPKEKVKGAALRVLLTLADHADPDGKGAYPSQATLAKLTGYGRRTIQTTLSTLENEGLITKGDQRLTAHLQYRPIVWDLAIHQDTQTTTDTQKMRPSDTAGAQSGAQSGAQYDCAQTNKHINHINHINQERDARTRTREEHHINQTWKPKPKHKALADELRLDLDWEAQKFIARARDRGDASADWDARFETWLRRGAELGIHAATPAKPPHRHTWKCSHTLQLLHRQDDEAAPDDIACTTANALNAGIDADQVTQAIDTGNPSTLQDLIWESA